MHKLHHRSINYLPDTGVKTAEGLGTSPAQVHEEQLHNEKTCMKMKQRVKTLNNSNA